MVHNDMQEQTQMSVQIAAKEDALQMAEVLYKGLRSARYWAAIYPEVKRDDWIEAQADFCLQHIGQPNSVAYVAKDSNGKVTGVAYGRMILYGAGPKCKSILGRNDVEYQKIDNTTFHKSLIGKYGDVFCERTALSRHPCEGAGFTEPLSSTGIEMFAVYPEHQGKGLGKKLLEAVLLECKQRRLNVALQGVEGKVALSADKH